MIVIHDGMGKLNTDNDMHDNTDYEPDSNGKVHCFK